MAVFLTSKKRKENKMTEKMSARLEQLGIEMTGPYGGLLHLKFTLVNGGTYQFWIRSGTDGDDSVFRKDYSFFYEHHSDDECLHNSEGISYLELHKFPDAAETEEITRMLASIDDLIKERKE